MRQALPLFLTLSLCAQPLFAAPKSINDCEKIQAADAYNQCLAQFGPVAHEHKLGPMAAGADGGHHHAARHRFYRGGRATHRHYGRQHMTLSVTTRGHTHHRHSGRH